MFPTGVNIVNLTEATRGKIYRIQSLARLNTLIQRRLLDIGVTEGIEVICTHIMPFGGPYILNVCGQQISLRKADVYCIDIEEVWK